MSHKPNCPRATAGSRFTGSAAKPRKTKRSRWSAATFPAQILKKLGAKQIRLLSNNPEKVRQLEQAGIDVAERVPCQPRISKISRGYLKTKKKKMGHLLKGV